MNRASSPTFLRHYHRICLMYAGPNNADWRRWAARGTDATGRAAMALLNKWRGEAQEFPVRASWASGFAHFEDRVAAIGATYREGALTSRQAA